MKCLLFLFPILAFAQTDLPGPVAALPASAASTGVCGWNKTQTFKGCLTVQDTITALTGTAVFGPTNTYWQFDRSLQAAGAFPTTNLTGTIGGCQTSGTCPGGLAAPLEWLGLHVQNIYNYGPNPFTIYSDSTLIAIDAFSTQPIQFYTNNTLRGQFLSGGQFELANMAGSGNRCARVNSSGDFSPTGGDCIDPTVPNTFTATQTFSFNPVSLIVGSEIQPATGGGGAPIVHLGDTSAQFLDLFVDTIYNYNTTGSLGMVANTLPIIVDTLSNQPIQFYTQNTLRTSVLGSGDVEIYGGNLKFSNNSTQIGDVTNEANLIVSSNFFSYHTPGSTADYCAVGNGISCVTGTSAIQFFVSPTTGAITSNLLAGTGFRDICANSTGGIVVSGSCPAVGGGVSSVTATSPIVSSGGATPDISCPTCSTNDYVVSVCGTNASVSTTYTSICSLTFTQSGYWLISASLNLVVDYQSVATCWRNIGATPANCLTLSSGGTGELIGAPVSMSSVSIETGGSTLTLEVAKVVNAGVSQANSGIMYAVFLHP